MGLRPGGPAVASPRMLHLLVDTSTWLDLAKRRDGQKWIVSLRLLVHWQRVDLLVPTLVLDEFVRNRPRVEASMTASIAERFRLLKTDFDQYGGGDDELAAALAGLAHQVPLVGAMTSRNFDDIADLLSKGRHLEPGDVERTGAIRRALDKRAPFHRAKNSVADALIIECYASASSRVNLDLHPHAFVTSNSSDFSLVGGDQRQSHEDLAPLFDHKGSSYALGVEGLDAVLRVHFAASYDELLEESYFEEEPRRLDEIQASEQEFFERISYQRAVNRVYREAGPGDPTPEQEAQLDARAALLAARYGDAGPYSDFEWGMINGKLSALRWVLGSEWDFLDT